MRLRNLLFPLMAFALALSSALPANATAFTIPEGNTYKAKPSWWPNGTQLGSYNVRDFAALNGQLWCIVVNGSSSAVPTIKLVDGETFESIKDINVTGVTSTGTFPLSNIRRMGDQIVACNGVSGKYLKVYRWKNKNSAPDVILSLTDFAQIQGMGVWGDMTNGKLYFLKATDGISTGSNTLCIFTVANGTVNTTPKTITLASDAKAGTRQYSIAPMDDGTLWLTTNSCWGLHIKESDGTIIEKFTGKYLGAANGIGQKHFTFMDRNLAVSTNCCKDVSAIATNFTAAWTSPIMGLIDYTDGVGAKQTSLLPLWDAPLSTASQSAICTTGADYEISDSGNRLDVWGIDPIGGIYHAWFDKTDQHPSSVPNFKAEARWDGVGQKVSLSWNAADKATSYRVYDYTEGESSETKVYEGSETSCTLDLAIGGGKEHKYRIVGVNEYGTSKASSYANTYDAGFGEILLTGLIEPDDETSTAKLEWNAPTGGTLKDYTIVKNIKKTGNDGSESTSTEDYLTIPAGTTKYDYVNFSALSSVTEGEVTYSIATSLYIRANMEQTVTTKDGTANTVKSNTVTPSAAQAPYFTSVTTYKGRRTVALAWEVASTTNLDYYELYRDGIRILDSYNGGSYIDTDLPDGTYSYQVIAYWSQNGTVYTTRSTTVSATIKYSSDVSTYILDNVYDYPIMTEEEWNDADQPLEAVVAKGLFANAKTSVGAYGAPGDIYRQAQYYGGKWYIAQLTARTELSSSGNYIPNNYGDLPTGVTADKYKSDWAGGIYSIGADAATIRTIGDNMTKEIGTWGLENQFVAVDESGSMWRRATHSAAFTDKNALFYRPTLYLHGKMDGTLAENLIQYNGKNFYELCTASTKGDADQNFRTHYISAGGKFTDGTAFILMAMNRSADTYRVTINTDRTVKSVDLFSAPTDDIKDKDGKTTDVWGSTENYSFPVAGRNAFIQTIRGIGSWYVDGTTGKHTLLYSTASDIRQCGGVTFTYNNEMFILHPSSIRSNNPGYFRIDMVQRKSGETAETVVPTKENLIPTVANKLDETASFTAGNSNASWYGAEYSVEDECVYIYQYVPGVRFAKYRLYIREQYPDVPPTLDITTGYNEDKTDITRFDSKITWQRPGTAHDYGLSENADITVDHYEVALKDKTGKTVQSWDNIADVTDANHVFTLEYNKNAEGVYNLDSEKYTAEIVPIYKRKNGTIIRGASNFAVDNNDYPAAIGEVKAYIYQGTGSAAGGYRVDIDFDRALTEQSPEPVSYFLVEVSTDGSETFNTLGNFNLLKRGEDYHHYPVNVTNGQVPGQYKFGTTNEGDSPSEKGYALRENANYATDYPCVLYYYTNADPSGYKYRVTAVYASTNRAITKTASNNAENIIGGTSGIGDATGYTLGAYPVPATTTVTVTSPEAIRDIRVFSASGAEVARATGEEAYTQTVDVSALAPGIYMLVVNEQTPIRIVKK